MRASQRISTVHRIHSFLISKFCTASEPWTVRQATHHFGTIESISVDSSTGAIRTGQAPCSPQTIHGSVSTLKAQLAATFLPVGYPKSVAPGYLRYVSWQAIHHGAGAANGVLASTFLLYSVGLGAGAIPTAGALSWVLKDGLGQLGTLMFGRAMAHNFDVAARKWYVTASAKLNVAMGLEIATFVAPQWFLPLGAFANAVKGLAWMAGGSSRSAFNVSFATDRNIADITAKATSQTICTSLAGTAVGMAAAAGVGQSVAAAFACYAAFAALHMWTAVESARTVPLSTLNPSRLALLAEMYIRFKPSANVPSPGDLAPQDIFLPQIGSNNTAAPLKLNVGPLLRRLVATSEQQSLMKSLLPLYRHTKYILVPCDSQTDFSRGTFYLILHEEASPTTALTAALQAAVWYADQSSDQINSVAKRALERAERMTPGFLAALKSSGWDTQGLILESRRRRAVW